MSSGWRSFPHPSADYDYEGPALGTRWNRLHQGDREPFPDRDWIDRLVAAEPRLKPPVAVAKAAATLQDAWRAYHRGDFAAAAERGLAAGRLGSNVANKATTIYATYIAPERDRADLFRAAAARAEALQDLAPGLANAWYFHAQALGRYGQLISVAKALAIGLGGTIRHSLDRTIALEPDHGEAHIALGAYHANVVSKVGALVAGLTYGARRDASIEHFETALRLIPYSAIARIEYAEGLVLLYGKAKLAAANRLYEEAAASEPLDAMERLDVERAREELAA